MINRPMNIIYEEPKGGTLWLGSVHAAHDINLLEEMGIKTVITIVKGMKISYPSTIKHIIFYILDDQSFNIKSYFNITNQIIRE